MDLPLWPPIFAVALAIIGYGYARYSAARIDRMQREAEDERRPPTPAR